MREEGHTICAVLIKSMLGAHKKLNFSPSLHSVTSRMQMLALLNCFLVLFEVSVFDSFIF